MTLPAAVDALGVLGGTIGLLVIALVSAYGTNALLRVVEHMRMGGGNDGSAGKRKSKRGYERAADQEDDGVGEDDGEDDDGDTLTTTATTTTAAAAAAPTPASGEWELHDMAQAAQGRATWALAIFSVVTCQLGSVIAYLVFVGVTLSDVLRIKPWVVVLALYPVYGGLCLARSTERFAFSSLLGNMALVLCMGSILAYGCSSTPIFLEPTDYVWGFEPAGLSVFFGLALFR